MAEIDRAAPLRFLKTAFEPDDWAAIMRHMFVDADDDGVAVLSRVRSSRPTAPSYVLHTSPNHIHLFWRVSAFDGELVERLQKQLARELGTDPAGETRVQSALTVT